MDTEPAAPAPRTFYEAVGGEEFFDRLVHRFYELVAEDPELRAVYPSQDLQPAEDHLRLFLIQYCGGPQTYNELRGHPRLRMGHTRTSVAELGLDPELDAMLCDCLVMAAHSLLNRPSGPLAGQDLGLSPR